MKYQKFQYKFIRVYSFYKQFYLIIFPILFGTIYAFRSVFRRSSLLQRRAEATLNAFVEEQISGIQITKSFGQEKNVLDNFDILQAKKVGINVKQQTLFRVVGPLFDFIAAIGLFILLLACLKITYRRIDRHFSHFSRLFHRSGAPCYQQCHQSRDEDKSQAFSH